MTLDELISRLQEHRTIVGGDAPVGLFPSVYYSDMPTFAEKVVLACFKRSVWCPHKKDWVPTEFHNVVTIK